MIFTGESNSFGNSAGALAKGGLASLSCQQIPQPRQEPKEPGIYDRSLELLSYLRQLGDIHAQIRSRLFGPETCDNCKEDGPADITEALARATRLAASLVGEAKGIESRL